MRIKKILSLAVVLAMVLTVVPMFGISASAATGSSLSDETLLAAIKYTTPDFDALNPAPAKWNGNNVAVGTAYAGWSGGNAENADNADDTGNILNVSGSVEHPRIQVYKSGATDGDSTATEVNCPDYGEGKDYILLSFIAEFNANWGGDVALKDIDGKLITAFRMGNDNINVSWGHDGTSSPFNGGTKDDGKWDGAEYTINGKPGSEAHSAATLVDILVKKADDNKYVATYFINGIKLCDVTYNGTFNGLGSFMMDRGCGAEWARIALQEPVIRTGNIGDVASVTVNYVDKYDNSVVDTYTVDSALVGKDFTPYADEYYANLEKGVLYKVDSVDTIEVEASNNVAKIIVTPYKGIVGKKNLATNGDLEAGTTDGWTDATGAASTKVEVVEDNGGKALAIKCDGTTNSNEETLVSKVEVTPGKDYYMSIEAKGTVGLDQFMWFAALNDEQMAVDDGDKKDFVTKGTGRLESDRMYFASDKFVKTERLVTVPDGAKYLAYVGTYFQDSKPILDNFTVYELGLLDVQHNVDVKYTAGGETVEEIKDSYDERDNADGYTLPEKYYRKQGSNVLYHADAVTYTGDQLDQGVQTIEMKPVVNTFEPLEADQVVLAKIAGNKDAAYKITGKNIVPNGDFSNGLAGWYDGTQKPATEEGFTVNKDGTISVKNAAGGTSINAIWGVWPVEANKTYVFTMENGTDTVAYTDTITLTKEVGQTEAANDVIIGLTSGGSVHGMAGDYFPKGVSYTAFTVPEGYNYLSMWFRWHDPKSPLGKIGLYEAAADPDSDVTVKVNYQVDGETVGSVEKTVLKGDDAKFDRYQYTKASKYYAAEALTYSNVVEDATYDIPMGVDDTIIGASADFTWGYKSGAQLWAGDRGFNSQDATDKKAFPAIGWYNDTAGWRSPFVAFPVKTEEGKKIVSVTLNMFIASANNDNNKLDIYAIDPKYIKLGDTPEDAEIVGADEMKLPENSGGHDDDAWNLYKAVGGVKVGEMTNTGKKNDGINNPPVHATATIDLSNVDISGDTLALVLTTRQQTYIYSTRTDFGPYLSDIVIKDVPADPTAELGFDGKEFFINFAAESGKLKITPEGGDAKTFESNEATVTTNNVNRIYTAVVDATETAVASAEKSASIYSLVIEAINGLEANVAADKKDAVNKVIAQGGVYMSAENVLPKEVEGVLAYDKDTNVVSVNDTIFGYGVGFTATNGEIYVGSDGTKATPETIGDEGVYQYMKIDIEGAKVTLSNDKNFKTQDAVVLSLDSVNIEFVETLIDALESDGADAEAELEPVL